MSDESFEGFGVPFPLPAELVDILRKQTDRVHMTAEAIAAQVDGFLAGLDVEGLMSLRIILNTGDMNKSISANFFDGQVLALLKYVHHVDPESGKDPLAPPVE